MDTQANLAVLGSDQFEGLILAGLARLGMPPGEAAAFAASRWPMEAETVLAECRGRGLALGLGDLTGYVRARWGRDTCDDGQPLLADTIVWPRHIVQDLLDWAVAEGRGTAPEPGPPVELPPLASLAEMLDALHHENVLVRVVAGQRLAASVGAGLKLSRVTDEEFAETYRPLLGDLIARAMAGDGAAIVELSNALTVESPAQRLQALAN